MSHDDTALLQRFATYRDEEAFRLLVQRHLPLVHSVAKRVTADYDLARDVAQETFIRLAGKPGSVPSDLPLAAWLHRTARSLAANLVRTEIRRKNREASVALPPASHDEPIGWNHLSPVIDSLVDHLPAIDRHLLIQRYYQGQTHSRVAVSVGLSEEAARKRTLRALEKLRVLLERRGITTTASVLGTILPAHAITSVPVWQVREVAHLALAVKSSAFTPVALKFFLMNQTTKTTLAASLTLTLIGIATAQISRPTAPGVRSPDASARVSAEHVSVETAPLINGEPPRPDVRPKRPELPSKSGPDQKPESKVFAKVESQVPANGSLVMGGEVNELGMRQFYILTPQRSKGSDGKDLVLLNCDVISMSQAEATQAGLNSLFTEKETTQQNAEIWTKEDYSSTLKALAERGGKALIKSPAVVTRAEEEVRVEMSDAGVKLKLCTKVSFAGQDGFIVKSELRK